MTSLLRRVSHLFLAILLVMLPGLALASPSGPPWTMAFSPDAIGIGNESRLTFTIDNSSSSAPVDDLAFSGTLPTGLVISSGAQSDSCSGTLTAPTGGSSISYSNGRISLGASCTISLMVTSNASAPYTFTTGDLTSSFGNSGTASANLSVNASLTGFGKSFSPSSQNPGSITTLTYTLDNTTNGSTAALSFSEVLPAGLELATPANISNSCVGTVTASSGGSSISANSIFLAAGATCTVSVDVKALTSGDYVLTNELTNFAVFPSVIVGEATATLTVNSPPSGGIGFFKSFDVAQAGAGETVTLNFALSNTSRTGAATNIAFTDDLNAMLSGLTATTLPADGFCGVGSTMSGSSSLTVSGASLASAASCNFDVSVLIPAGAATGSYTNSTSSLSADLDGSAYTGSAASTTLQILGDGGQGAHLSKSFTDDPVAPGNTVTARYTLTNPNAAVAISDITFQDTISAVSGATISTLPASGSCGGSSAFNVIDPNGFGENVFLLSGGALAAGASCNFDVVINIPGSLTPGSYSTSTTDLTTTVAASSVTTPGASDTLTVSGGANLSFVKEFSDEIIGPGSSTTLTFTLTSAAESPSTATGLSFSDDLTTFMAGTSFSINSNTCGGSPGLSAGDTYLNYTGGTLAPGDSCSVVTTVTIPAAAAANTYTNTTSTLTGTAGGEALTVPAASDTLQVLQAQPLVTSKSFTPSSALPGETVTLTYTLTNPDPTYDYTGGFFTDSYSTALTNLAASSMPANDFCGTGSSASGTTFGIFIGLIIPAGGSCSFDVPLLVPVAAADGDYSSTTSNVAATVNGGAVVLPAIVANFAVDAAQIQLTKAYGADPVAPGDTVSVDYTLTNLSSSKALTAIAFSDDLDTQLTGLASTSGAQSNLCGAGSSLSGTGTLTFAGGSLAAGASCSFSATLQVPGGSTASIYSGTTSTVSADASGLTVTGPAVASTLTVSAFELPSFAKSFADPALGPGASTTLTYLITNNDSTTTLNGLRFTDDLDAALSGLAVTAGTGSNLCGTGSVVAGSGAVTLTGGTLAPGQSCSIALTVTVPSSAAAGSYPGSTSTLTEDGEFAASAASATFTVEPAPTFAKAFATDSVGLGNSTTLTFTVDNTAAVIAATTLDVTDSLPAGLVVAAAPNASASCTGGTLTATAGSTSISYTGGSVAAAASCSFSVDVEATAAGTLVNTSGDLTSSLGNSGSASDSLKVPSLSLDSPLATDDVINSSEAASLTVSGTSTLIEDAQGVSVTVTDSASATATGATTVSGGVWSLTVDVSGLSDGALSLVANSVDAAGTGPAQASTTSLSKETVAPAGHSVSFDQASINASNETAISFTFAAGEVGAGYSYTLSSAGGGAPVTGTGTLATATDQITGLDLSGLGSGTVTLSVVLTDTVGNEANAVTDTATKDTTAPGIAFDSPLAGDDVVNAAEAAATTISGTTADLGDGLTVSVVVTDSASATVSQTTTATGNVWSLVLDLSALADGALNLTADVSDAAGNPAPQATASLSKDTGQPTVSLSGPSDAQSDPFTVDLVFSETVTGLLDTAFAIDNGTASNLTGSGASYSVTVTPDHDGTVTISLPADSAQDGTGNGNLVSNEIEVIADLTGTPDPTPEPDADGDGVPDNLESSTADRDGDGIPDAADYDPQGYFYCEDDGRILSGGGITVTGPSGSNSSVGISNNINIVRDGSSGEYQWFALVPGTYSVAYSYPATGIASTARLSSGSLDVTSLLPANPAVIGSTEVGSTGVLADASLAANPAFYDSFVIEAGDPNVLANNIPMTQCAQIEVTVSATDTGAEANGATTDSASFTVSQAQATAQDSVLSYTLGGTATPGTDFTAPTGSVTILAGDTSAVVDMPVLEDGLIEGSETVTLTLTAVTSGSAGVILSTTTADLTGSTSITDDDFAVVAVSNDDLTASESGNDTAAMSFTLLGQPGQDVQLAFSGDAQCSVSPAVLSFTSVNYASAQTLTIAAIDDDLVEGSHSCQPTVAVTSADPAFDGFVLALASVTVTDDLVDQIREPLTEILKNDLEETVKTQQRYFSDMSKGALSRLRAGAEGLGCGTLAGFDIDGSVNITGGEGQTDGSFGYDVYNCHSGSREILDGAFSLTRTDNIGTQALLQFSRQRERFLSETDLRGNFLGGYLSRTNVTGLADGAITGMGVNGGIYGARELSDGLFLDYYAAGAFGHHRYDLDFAATPSVIQAEGSYDYAAAFAGAALSGQHQMNTLLVTPRLGVDLAYALASDADVTATQLAQTDTGRIDIPDYNGGRLFAEIEFSGFGSNADPTDPNAISSRMALAPRLACESSSYDTSSSNGCGFGLSFSREVFNPLTGLTFSFEIDYEMIDDTDRVSVDFHRERRFADDRGAVVTRLSMPTSDSLKIEHGVRLDF